MVEDTLITVCPWWDGPLVRADVARLLDEAAQKRNGGAGSGSITPRRDRSPTSWTGEAAISAMPSSSNGSKPTSRTSSSRDTFTSHLSIAQRLLGGPAGGDLGVQRRAPVRGAARPYHPRHRRGDGAVVLRRRELVRPSRPAVGPSGREARRAAGLAHIAGSGWRLIPARIPGSADG